MAPAISVNHERAEWVIRTLIDAWHKKLPPFDRIKPVPARFPQNLERGSVQEARWLFNCCYLMRGKINSATALVKLSYLHERVERIFDPYYYVDLSARQLTSRTEELQFHLQQSGLGFNFRETSRFWILNYQKLARFWEGNPLLFFERAKTYEELCAILMQGKRDPDSATGFMCFRHKMVSMLTYFYAEAGLIDPFAHPGPVDFHNLRIGLSTGILVPEGMGEGAVYSFDHLSPVMRDVYTSYCKTPAETLFLANGLWYQSRTFCTVNQGNSSTVSRDYRARDTEITPRRVRWLDGDIDRYNRSCGVCSLEPVCKWSIPSANQYNEGVLRVRGERPVPHKYQLPILEVPRVLRPGRHGVSTVFPDKEGITQEELFQPL